MTIILHLITHLKRWISQVISVNPPTPLIVIDDSSTLSAQDDHLLQVDSTTPRFNYKTPLFVEIELVPEFEEPLDNGMSTMTMNCSYSIKRLIHHHDYELFLLSQEIDPPSQPSGKS